MNKQAGFSLIELIIVVCIIGTLAGIVAIRGRRIAHKLEHKVNSQFHQIENSLNCHKNKCKE